MTGLPGTMVNLPVVPLAVPHPASFMYLLQTLYTHKVSWLLDQLVPVPKGLAPEIACLATDSLITAYNAVHNAAGVRVSLIPSP